MGLAFGLASNPEWNGRVLTRVAVAYPWRYPDEVPYCYLTLRATR